MDDAERIARNLDEQQKIRFRKFKGNRDEFFNEYERKIYFRILELYKKSKTYEKESS
jgi:hypothetical protein